MTEPKSHPKTRRMVTAVRAVERIRKLLRGSKPSIAHAVIADIADLIARVRPPGLDHRGGPRRKKPCACPPRNRDAEAFLDDGDGW